MKEKKILHYLDLTSFISLIIVAGFILYFQANGTLVFFKIIVGLFSIALLALCLVYEMIIIVSSKNKEFDDEESKEIFTVSKKQRNWMIFKLVLLFVCFCFSSYIFLIVKA